MKKTKRSFKVHTLADTPKVIADDNLPFILQEDSEPVSGSEMNTWRFVPTLDSPTL